MEKVLWEWQYSLLLSRPHEHGHFWSFFTIQSQNYNPVFYFEGFMMYQQLDAKNDFHTPLPPFYEII